MRVSRSGLDRIGNGKTSVDVFFAGGFQQRVYVSYMGLQVTLSGAKLKLDLYYVHRSRLDKIR